MWKQTKELITVESIAFIVLVGTIIWLVIKNHHF